MPKSSKKIIAVSQVIKTKRRKKRSKRTGNALGNMSWGLQPTVDYFKSLVDPFECSPPKLGWGCMVPSTIGQAYLRGSATVNADGSIAFMAMPSVKGGIQINTAGAGVATWTAVDYANIGNINTAFGEGRVISVGIKATPNIALTSVPAMVYSGAFTPTTFINATTMTPTDLQQMVTSHQSVSTNGATSTGRPVDPDSFTFQIQVVGSSGWGTYQTLTMPFSVPYLAFIGLPASTVVFYEVCLNFEGTPVVGHNQNTVIPATEGYGERKLSDSWQNPETMINKVKPFLPHPGRASDAAAAKDSSFLQTVISGLGGVAGAFFGGPGGVAIGSGIGNALGSVAQSLFNPDNTARRGAQQNYSSSYRGYKL